MKTYLVYFKDYDELYLDIFVAETRGKAKYKFLKTWNDLAKRNYLIFTFTKLRTKLISNDKLSTNTLTMLQNLRENIVKINHYGSIVGV